MNTAKIFQNGKSQAVRLPQKYRFQDTEVYVAKLGDAVLLVPKDKAWQTFLDGLNGFSDDFIEDGREPEIPSPREIS
ncbi:MAG: type II toxin-antitoxin system VapB family antitoxin [Oscillospiraceae bacterium]|nr:type II toxin-antitoxin system VapB family antitoxin [Oscillospiraceae bacterium]